MADHTAHDMADEPGMTVDELAPGTKLMNGSYTVEKFLNAGGFGITYSAVDSLDRRVVIKECFPGAFCRRSQYIVAARSRAHQKELASMVSLFVQEARSLAKLVHPNIVGVHQIFEENNTAYMALDFVEGRDLLDVIEKGDTKLNPAQVENILRKVLDAVGFVHAAGILHRDISPDNILLDDRMEPVLIDFGAAREEATRKSRVLSALRVVKDGYSPQEFYVQGSEQGPYSDLYSLAATFYHLIAGKLPPDSQVRVNALAGGEPDPYEPLEGQIPELSKNFLRALDKAMNVLPRDRLQSAKEWLDMLEGVEPVRRPTRALSREAAVEAGPNSARGMILASVATIALLGGGGVIGWQAGMFGDAPETVVVEEPSVAEDTQVADAPAVTEDTQVADAPEAEAEPTFEFAGPPPTVESPTAPAPEAIAQAPEPEETTEPNAVAEVEEEPSVDPVDEPAIAIDETSSPLDTEIAGEPFDEPVADQTGGIEALGRMANAPQPRPANDSISIGFQQGPDAPSVGDAGDDSETSLAAVEPVTGPSDAPTIEEAAQQPETLGVDVDSAPAVDAESTDLALDQTASDRPVLQAEIPTAQDDAPAFQDVAAAALSVDDTPDAPPPGGEAPLSLTEFLQRATEDAVEDDSPNFVSAPVVEAADDHPIVKSAKVVRLPFEGLFEDTVGNLRLFAVDGTPVGSQQEFDAVMQSREFDGSIANIIVRLGVSEATAVDAAWELPVLHQARLINGLTFETRQSDGSWQTTVTEVPTSLSDALSPGDVVVGLLDTSERIDGPEALDEILKRELDDGKENLNLAVLREGAMWGVNISLADLRTASAE